MTSQATFPFKNSELTQSVVSLPLAVGFFTDAKLLGVVHHFMSGLPTLGRGCEKLRERVDKTLGLVVKAKVALREVVVFPHREEQLVVARVTVAGGAGGRVGRGRTLLLTPPAQLLEGPPRSVVKRTFWFCRLCCRLPKSPKGGAREIVYISPVFGSTRCRAVAVFELR